ncbi:hypothetical protein [Rhizobium sullae]|nr:hypothetical protein [Rhizobium sullae]
MDSTAWRFTRHISDVNMDLLERAVCGSEGAWLRDALRDRELFFGLRNDRIDVYHQGALIYRIDFSGDDVVAQTHVKYLMIDVPKSPYIPLRKSGFAYEPSAYMQGRYREGVSLQQIKKASTYYSGVENFGVYRAIKNDPLVVDVEVALVRDDAPPADSLPETTEQRQGRKQDRIDIVRLEETAGGCALVFWEAKHYSNAQLFNGEIFEQLERYEDQILKREDQLLAAYRNVCEFYRRLALLRSEFGVVGTDNKFVERLQRLADGTVPLHVDKKPRLFAFGFDQAQKMSRWRDREGQLIKRLGPGRLRAIGKPDAGALGRG